MKLKEAIDFIKDVADICPNLEGKNIILMTSAAPNTISVGYEVVIRKNGNIFDKSIQECLLNASKARNLSATFGLESIIIFTPKRNSAFFESP